MISFSRLGEESYLANNRARPSQGLLKSGVLLRHLNFLVITGRTYYNSHLRGKTSAGTQGTYSLHSTEANTGHSSEKREELNARQTCCFITQERRDTGVSRHCTGERGENS